MIKRPKTSSCLWLGGWRERGQRPIFTCDQEGEDRFLSMVVGEGRGNRPMFTCDQEGEDRFLSVVVGEGRGNRPMFTCDQEGKDNVLPVCVWRGVGGREIPVVRENFLHVISREAERQTHLWQRWGGGGISHEISAETEEKPHLWPGGQRSCM